MQEFCYVTYYISLKVAIYYYNMQLMWMSKY